MTDQREAERTVLDLADQLTAVADDWLDVTDAGLAHALAQHRAEQSLARLSAAFSGDTDYVVPPLIPLDGLMTAIRIARRRRAPVAQAAGMQ